MTVVEDRPAVEVAAPPPSPAAAVADSWFDTADHKRIGVLFVYASFAFLVASGVAALVIGAKQASPSLSVSASVFGQLYGLHAQSGLLLFLTALWIGLATYLVPLQIGAGRLALPRLSALGFWAYLFGGGLFLVSYVNRTGGGLGITQSTPLPAPAGGADAATILWIASLALVSLGFLLAAASLLVTVAGLRTDGMTLLRVPAFSWAALVASAVTLVSTPVFLAGLLLFGIDQRFGGALFSPSTGGGQAIWQRTVWLYGRPDVYLLTILALGAASDVVATHARRPLLQHRLALVLLALAGALSLGAFASGDGAAKAVVVPTFNVVTAAIAVPIGLTVLLWLGTLAAGGARFDVSLLFVAGAIVLWAVAAANAIGAAAHHVDGLSGTSAWIAGNVHTAVVGPPTLIAFAALYHWAPKLWGRRLRASAAGLVFLTTLGGLAATGLAYYFLGFNGAPVAQVAGATSYQKGLYTVAEVAGAVLVVGVVVFLADLLMSVGFLTSSRAGDNPYGGLTLEWATTSPPPPWGFDAVPEVRSEAPLFHLQEESRP